MKCPYGVGEVVLAQGHCDIDVLRLVRRLGDGASAFVFEAEDVRLGGRVAIKLVRAEASPERFHRECAALQALAHPSIVRLLSFGFTLGVHRMPFLVMPLLTGAPLRTVLDGQGPLRVERGLDHATELFVALAQAHGAGLLHRDLRPENLLLERIAPLVHRLVLLDFGLSCAASPSVASTREPIGDPRYAAPELFYGYPSSVATDLYAAGLVLFEMLTGKHPLGTTSHEWAHTHYFTAAPPLEALVTVVPPALSALQASLLAKQPRQRPRSAEACAQALCAIQQELLLPAPNSTLEDDVDSMLRRMAGPGEDEDTQVDLPSPSLLRQAGNPNDTDVSPPPSSSNWPVAR
jgi:eukaryotic-like serine/threonine-protein kinase